MGLVFIENVSRHRERKLGLYLLGQRWYDSEVGRFISRDPIGEKGGVNLYVYVGNNPVNTSDSEGLDVSTCQDRCNRASESCREHCRDLRDVRRIVCYYCCNVTALRLCYIACLTGPCHSPGPEFIGCWTIGTR